MASDPNHGDPTTGPPTPEADVREAAAEAPPETPMPAAGETVSMSQVAGERPTALAPPEAVSKKKRGKKTLPMTAAGPTEGALSPADQALADLGTKRGIETLFRSSYRVQMDLSALADAKANIMISINGLLVGILVGALAPGIDRNPWLLIPSSLFLLGCLVSLIFAILAARPRVQSQVVSPETAIRKGTNILFFGNFSHMTQDEFVYVMKETVQDPTQIYTMMMKDIYGVGSVLQKKYRLLRSSYTAFLVALTVGVLSFIGVFAYTTTFDDPVAAPPGAPTEVQPAPSSGPTDLLPLP
ncbi:MAG: Pycsar system effector family protein [Bacteroidota bacterium]